MKQKYRKWIKNYKGETYRRCVEVSLEMKRDFPELIIKKGLIRTLESEGIWLQHQWLETSEGETIDPTAKQYLAIMEYKPINDGDLEPVGKCMHCGEMVFGKMVNGYFCDKDCTNKFVGEMKK